VLIPANLISQLSGPDILPVLLEHKSCDDEGEGKPIVLILEDADDALLDRKSGNLSALSNILNLGDGILGEMADLRLVATTNAKFINLDDAITRPGRLCTHAQFNDLSADISNKIYKKLVGSEETPFNTSSTLATIYRRARNDGWNPPSREQEALGQYI
jgi:SpoVK/Ycf46/Vps4 family AAA+-type ATPase